MTANTLTRTETRVDVGTETARFTVGAINVVAALIGVWGFACLIGGLAANGAGGLLRGYITAVTGM